MATIDTHRAAYNRPNPNLPVGQAKKESSGLTPTIRETEEVFYTVRVNGMTKNRATIKAVNELLAIYPNAQVVKTTRKVTTEIRHKRIR